MPKAKRKPVALVLPSERARQRAEAARRRATKPENRGGLSTAGGVETETGIPVTEQDQGLKVVTSHDSGAVMGACPPPSEGEGEAVEEATIVAAKINTHAAGAWPIAALREGQCRFACTGHNVPPDQHRFCGQPTEIGPGNLHGSWCPEHLARMFDTTSRLARPAFLKAMRGGR